MPTIFYNVAPRYTPGSPALVPEAIARDLARAELSVFNDAMKDRCHPGHYKALDQGLAWIAWEQWESGGLVYHRCLLTACVRAFKPGQPLRRVTAGMLAGLLVQVVSRSRRTSTVTVRLVEPRGAYKIGDQVHVGAYELSDETRL